MILLIIDFLAVITTFLMWLSKLELKIILDVLKPVLIQITPLVWLLSSAFILSLAW
ncbi:hypothetical protein NADFUDRAFT_83190 [Nadsonia fulvescens var. elongata DSM 6958]|uniref:Uncharacterized protein n=1 Tax=Nadsonia fulvescens var. elongata DSM 6958 TaxID=857566 RepID=A0A1E3PIT5_9ASCO|nr:hypothetical protein NADFUDRAFT_83190 [Nadsonia fulvescens var. elongata DSM 6958]